MNWIWESQLKLYAKEMGKSLDQFIRESPIDYRLAKDWEPKEDGDRMYYYKLILTDGQQRQRTNKR